MNNNLYNHFVYNKPKLTSNDNNYINQAKVLDRYNEQITSLKRNPTYRDDLSQITANNSIQRELINDYLQNQKNRYVNKDDPILHYNPIIEYNNNGGKISNTTIRFESHDINIDSSYRRKEPRITYSGNTRLLENNCLTLNNNSSLLYIQDNNHPYNINDKIILNGITPLKLYVNSNNLKFNNNSKKINIDINIKNDEDIFSDNFNNAYLEINNFTNLDIYSKNVNYVGNIPITIINNEHKFNFTKNNNIIYIEFDLPFKYIENSNYPLSNIPRTFNIIFYFYANIPIYYLNAYYPTNNYAKNNYHIINKIDKNGYYIDLGIVSNKTIEKFGKNISVRKIYEFEKGYEEPNDYVIELTKSYKNVIQVEMLSSEFPCMDNIIFKNKSIKTAIIQGYNSNNEEISFIQNNKFYWQNEDDGNFTYEIEIEPGKYTIDELCDEIHNKVYNVKRNFWNDDLLYNNNNIINIEHNLSKDLITFKSFNEYNFNTNDKYIIISEDEYNKLSDDEKLNVIISFDNVYYYKNHNGNFRIIELDYDDENGIFINNNYYNIINIKTLENKHFLYAFQIDNNINFDKFYIKNKFRLLFNKNDTFGNMLGFADVGKDTSITKFDYEITNKMLYYPSLGYELYNDDINIGNSINLINHSYIIMTCDELPVMDNVIGINKNNVFQKIQLNGISNVVNGTNYHPYTSGAFVFNTFIKNMQKIYFIPIHEISKLTFKFFSSNGELYDFNGIDHSFTLRITTLENIPEHTNINAQTSNYI